VDLLYAISHGGRCVIMATHDYTHMKKVNARVVRCEEENCWVEAAAQLA
jgi:ABC-type ATPase involved in cell division